MKTNTNDAGQLSIENKERRQQVIDVLRGVQGIEADEAGGEIVYVRERVDQPAAVVSSKDHRRAMGSLMAGVADAFDRTRSSEHQERLYNAMYRAYREHVERTA